MTTLADRIADFEAQANQLLDLPQQIANTAQARINQIGNYWDARVQAAHTIAYMHQQIGDDDAAGTESAPLKSVEEALRRTPPGGVCEVRLLAGYHFADVVPVRQSYLVMKSASSIRHAVTLERKFYDSAGTQMRITGGVRLLDRAAVRYTGVTLVEPPLDGSWGSYDPINGYSGFAQMGNSSTVGGQMVALTYCDIQVPSTPFSALVGNESSYPVELHVTACVATDQPLTGHLLSGATDTNGTAASSLPWLLTNLTTV